MTPRFYRAEGPVRSLLVPCRFVCFANREITTGKGKRTRTRVQCVAWEAWNPDPTLEAHMARLPGSGSFYWLNAIRVLVAAKAAMRADPSIHQIKLETISGQEIGRLYR